MLASVVLLTSYQTTCCSQESCVHSYTIKVLEGNKKLKNGSKNTTTDLLGRFCLFFLLLFLVGLGRMRLCNTDTELIHLLKQPGHSVPLSGTVSSWNYCHCNNNHHHCVCPKQQSKITVLFTNGTRLHHLHWQCCNHTLSKPTAYSKKNMPLCA